MKRILFTILFLSSTLVYADSVTKINDSIVRVTKTVIDDVDVNELKNKYLKLDEQRQVYQMLADKIQIQMNDITAELNSYKALGVEGKFQDILKEN